MSTTDSPYANQGLMCWRELADGRLLALVPQTYDGGMITLGPGGAEYDGGFSDGWQYEHLGDAYLQFLVWQPETNAEPLGWLRQIPSMRRRGAELVEEEPHA